MKKWQDDTIIVPSSCLSTCITNANKIIELNSVRLLTSTNKCKLSLYMVLLVLLIVYPGYAIEKLFVFWA